MTSPEEDHQPHARADRENDGWLATIGLNRPELRAWALYDWANSAMVTTIIAAVFPIFFEETGVAGGLSRPVAAQHFATASTVGMVFIAVLSPFLGTLADTRPIKKRFLGLFLGLGVGAVAAMFFIGRGQWFLAAFLFVLANIGANGSFVFYDSLLPHIARPDEVDRVSTAGYALGYLGGGLLLIANLAWILKPGWFGLPSGPGLTHDQATLPTRLAFLSVAVWWLVFSIPLFRKVPEPRIRRGVTTDHPSPLPGTHPLIEATARLRATFGELRRFRQGSIMLVAFLIYNDGIGTIFRMATIYGKSLGIDGNAMIAALVLVQFVGIPFAFAFGAMAGKVGAKRSIVAGLIAYVIISVLGYFMTTTTHFFVLAFLVGMVQGGTQALSRSLFASLIPRDRSGEFFGFFAVVEKFAGIFGPMLFALSIFLTGNTRNAILTVIPFFLVGGAMLLLVDVEEGQRQALAGVDPILPGDSPSDQPVKT